MGQLRHRDIEALFAASDIITLFVWENTDGWPVAYCSDNALKLLGYPKSMLERGEIKFVDKVHPEDLNRVTQEVNTAIHNPQITHFTHQDYRIVRATGEVIWISDTTVLDRDSDGKVLYLAGYLLNITERKRLELSLAAERNYFAQAIEGARLCSWDWNLRSKTVRVNSHCLRLLGAEASENELSEEVWLAYVHPDDRLHRQQTLQLHIAGMQPFYEDVYRVCTPAGEVRYVSDRGQIISRDEFGQPLQMSGILTDITEHKEAEIAAQEVAALKSQMLTEVSHEIRTPLHGILGLASLLEQQVENPKHEALLGTIRETGDYLLRTLNEVLETARAENMDAESAPSQIEFKKSDLAALAQQLQYLFYASVQEKGLRLLCEIDENVPTQLRFEQEKLLQILINLIDNAIKYTEQGEIRVRFDWEACENGAGVLIVEVHDTGIGIQNVEKVWELFVRENHQQTRSSGVGLSVVENLVTLLNGKIQVASTPGKGTRVMLKIPFEGGKDKAILVVDDSDVNQLVLGEMLTALNYRFITASNGEDALKVLASTQVDFVFMDLLMEGMSGLDTTRAIREQYGAALPIVGLTANPRAYANEEAMAVGMNELLSKPFTLQDIEKTLKIHLGIGVSIQAET